MIHSKRAASWGASLPMGNLRPSRGSPPNNPPNRHHQSREVMVTASLASLACCRVLRTLCHDSGTQCRASLPSPARLGRVRLVRFRLSRLSSALRRVRAVSVRVAFWPLFFGAFVRAGLPSLPSCFAPSSSALHLVACPPPLSGCAPRLLCGSWSPLSPCNASLPSCFALGSFVGAALLLWSSACVVVACRSRPRWRSLRASSASHFGCEPSLPQSFGCPSFARLLFGALTGCYIVYFRLTPVIYYVYHKRRN